MKVIRNNFFFLIVLCIAVAQISMMVLWKDHSFIAIHDNLDLFIAHNKMMKNEGAFFGKNVTLGMLGGIERDLLGSEFYLYNLLYFLFQPYTAYVLGYFLKIGIGFFSFLLLLKEVYGQEYNHYRELAWLVALSYGLIPVFPTYGIAFTSIPLLAFFLKRIVEQGKWYWYLGVFFYPFLSYFSYFGFFILGYLVLAVIVLWIKDKKIPVRLSLAVPVLSVGYVCFEYRLFRQILGSDTTTIRESMKALDLSLSEVMGEILHVMAEPGFHAQDSHKYIVLPVTLCLLLWRVIKAIRKKELKKILIDPVFVIFGWIILNCIIYGLYGFAPFRKLFETVLPPLKGFQFNRTIFLNPFLWFLLFFLLLKNIADQKKESKLIQVSVKTVAMAGLLAVTLIPQVYNDFYSNLYHHGYEIIKKIPSSQLSFEEFYSQELFEKIKEEIDYQGEWSAAYGMHPAVLQYNGIVTLDGYLGMYSEEYKQKFRKLIEPALEQSEEFRKTFDESGIRAYLYCGSGENTYVPVKQLQLKDLNLSINGNVFREMGGVYIFSRVKIENEQELGMKLLKKFQDSSSPYVIYVYQR